MNKYQEALNRIKVHVPDYKLINNHIVEVDKHSDLCKLQELIDRETPMKPIIKRNTHGHIMWGICDICKSREPIWFGQRCSNDTCGQKIDWSDEE